MENRFGNEFSAGVFMQVELNEAFASALNLLENGEESLFITGKAGTGKSTLLSYFRQITKKKLAVLAPTGVAAVNIQGETIHSFFRFPPGITAEEAGEFGKSFQKSQLFKALDTIIIDEISMVRADLLDCVDVFLRAARKKKIPFGGVRMVMIGDLYQLPPVVSRGERAIFKTYYETPYFFDASVIKTLARGSLGFIELEKIYRQEDDAFISLLNAVRNNSITDEQIERLNRRHQTQALEDPDGRFIHLTSLNKQADELNQLHLGRLPFPSHEFKGTVEGKFEAGSLPTEMTLVLKNEARVMFLNNDSLDRWVNGTLGTIEKIGEDEISVRLDNGTTETVEPFSWTLCRTAYNARLRSLEREEIGRFTQFPLRLAWAVTIHKSQGKTFDRVAVDLGRGAFSHGQVYVALSRCRSFEGLILKRPVRKKDIWMDYRVVRFLTRFQYHLAEESLPLSEKIERLEKAVSEKRKLRITYLKSKDEKSKRTILPLRVGEMEYEGKSFLGVTAHCFLRNGNRTFNVARILEIAEA